MPSVESDRSRRGQWRIERTMLEEFIAEAYRRAAQRIAGEVIDG